MKKSCWVAVVFAGAVALTTACSTGGTSVTCSAGATVACTGAAGCAGTQTCVTENTLGACECPSPDDGGDDSAVDASVDAPSTKDAGDSGPSLQGIGDNCVKNADCASNFCSSQTNPAWCTKICATNADCMGSASGGRNGRGRNNYCIPNGGGTKYCFPGCAQGQGDCDYFIGTTCIAAVDLNNANIDICSK